MELRQLNVGAEQDFLEMILKFEQVGSCMSKLTVDQGFKENLWKSFPQVFFYQKRDKRWSSIVAEKGHPQKHTELSTDCG